MRLSITIAALLLLTGCATHSTLYTPSLPETDPRMVRIVGAERDLPGECVTVATITRINNWSGSRAGILHTLTKKAAGFGANYLVLLQLRGSVLTTSGGTTVAFYCPEAGPLTTEVAVGVSMPDVLDLWGEPDKIRTDRGWARWWYSERHVRLLFHDRAVHEIEGA